MNKNQLQPIPGTELTEYVIGLLKINKILSPLQFLNEDVKNLTKFTNIPSHEIDILKSKLLELQCPTEYNAFTLFNLNNPFILYSTGIKSLDAILNGGFFKGNLIEFVGLHGTGKSLICCTLAINYAKQYNYDIIYLDTKNDFSGIRIYKILTSLKLSREEIGKIMYKIKIEKIYELHSLLNVLQSLLVYKKVSNSILIIDSIPALSFQYLGRNSKRGKILLNEIGVILKRLATEKKMLIFVINILTRWTEELDKEDNPSTNQYHTITKPALGNYWENIPTIRILIEELTTNINTGGTVAATTPALDIITVANNNSIEQRQLKIINSNFYETGQSCIVQISDCGFN